MHVHRQAYFSMVLAGGYREETGRRAIEYDVLTIVYHPPGTAHIDEIGPRGARFLTIEADDDLVSGERISPRLRSGYPVELPREAGWIALQLLRAEDSASGESSVLELLGLADGTPASAGAPAWLTSALEHVRDEFRAPPSARELARRAGVHPVHLARVVRRDTGHSLAGIVRLRRIEHAIGLLGSDEPLSSIALDCGFADQPHFTRAFRQVTGMCPGTMRRLLRS